MLGANPRRRVWRWGLWLIRAPVFAVDLPLRWLASLGDLVLIHWGSGLLKSLRRENGYLTAGSIVAVYAAIFGLIDTKSTQEETQAPGQACRPVGVYRRQAARRDTKRVSQGLLLLTETR